VSYSNGHQVAILEKQLSAVIPELMILAAVRMKEKKKIQTEK
jgi:hypothetical protein